MATYVERPGRGKLFREVVGPGLLLAVYGAVLMATLPEGFNRRFAMIIALVSCAVVAGALLVSILSSRSRRLVVIGTPTTETDVERPHLADVWLLLLPMAPVVQYMLVNRDTVSLSGALVGTMALAAFAAFVTLAIPYLAQRTISRTVALMVGLALSSVLFNMAAFASSNHWRGMEDASQPVVVFVALVIGGVALYRYRREVACVIAAAYFVSTIVLVPFTSEPSPEAAIEAPLTRAEADAKGGALARIARGGSEPLPDIIILTYDAYVENETMQAYGIDNSDQEAYLESQGFDIQRGTYTVAGDTIGSMGRVLGGVDPGDGIAGNSPLLDALRTAGYRTTAAFGTDYFFSKSDPGYDRYFPDPWPSFMTMLRGILEGRFRHDLAFSSVPHEDFVEMKRSALAADSATPELVYAHSGPGHSQNSGACLDDETDQFEARLATANLEMRDDIATVLDHRPRAIVIVNGDHGPYLTKNCFGLQSGDFDGEDVTRLDIQDRFGSFLAIRWPDGRQPAEAQIEVLQDVLPAVLVEVFPGLDSDALRGSTRLAAGEPRRIAGLNVEHGSIIGGNLDESSLFGTVSNDPTAGPSSPIPTQVDQ